MITNNLFPGVGRVFTWNYGNDGKLANNENKGRYAFGMVAQKGHPSLQFFKVTFCKLAVYQFCTFANMQFVNQALLQTCCLLVNLHSVPQQ